ncbi:unnamed protein product [Adineta steineri]|uniref:Uncharacterized protein n=1 Tax=Adineta steineri TaxID=433720 RepID=A0A819SM72_9BILA|nr:unnamed protein product [Adineta steineri]CAF4064248.1 unnamed protein product [Adineta steineri]
MHSFMAIVCFGLLIWMAFGAKKSTLIDQVTKLEHENVEKIEDEMRHSMDDMVGLREMNLTDADTDFIIRTMQSRETDVLYFALADNKLTYVGVKKLVEAIKKGKQGVRGLNLNGNPVGDAGVQYILKLFDNNIFEYLSIEDIGLTDNGVKELVDGILQSKLSSPVKILFIGNNKRITDHSVKQLLRLVGLNQLVKIDIVGCSLSDEAKKQLEQESPIFFV